MGGGQVAAFIDQLLKDMTHVRQSSPQQQCELEVRLGELADGEGFKPGIRELALFDRAFDVLQKSDTFRGSSTRAFLSAIANDESQKQRRRRIEWHYDEKTRSTSVSALTKRMLRPHVDLSCRPDYPFDVRLALTEECKEEVSEDDQKRPFDTIRLRRTMRFRAWRMDWTVRFDGPQATLDAMHVELEYEPLPTTTVYADKDELIALLFVLAKALCANI